MSASRKRYFHLRAFPGVDPILGPEMRSTGEVMGIDTDYAVAFAKSQLGGGANVPTAGTVFVSVKDGDKERIVPAVKALAAMGFQVIATGGTQRHLESHGVECARVNKVLEGPAPCGRRHEKRRSRHRFQHHRGRQGAGRQATRSAARPCSTTSHIIQRFLAPWR